jgi:hypothetical protein
MWNKKSLGFCKEYCDPEVIKSQSVYDRWKMGRRSIRVKGEKYSHSCPSDDFFKIANAILMINRTPGRLFKVSDIQNYLISNKVYDSNYFQRNSYKITVVINVLLLESLVDKKTKKGPYRMTDLDKACAFIKGLKERMC